MAVKIRLKRMGKIRVPQYRIVIVDSRKKRDGAVIEEIGKYHPTEEPSLIDISSERAQYWLAQGAQPTEAALNLLKVTGDWQKFKGEAGAEGTLQVKEAKRSKLDLFNEALAAAAGEPKGEAVTKRAAKKTEKPAEEAAEAVVEPAEAAEEAPAAEAPAADESAEQTESEA